MKNYQALSHKRRMVMIRLRRRLALLVAISGGLWSWQLVVQDYRPFQALTVAIITLVFAVVIDGDESWLFTKEDYLKGK